MMKKKLLFLSLFLLFTAFGFGQTNIVINGDFESWTAGLPDGWTTIDNGIIVTQETDTIHGGISSASVDVITGSQGSTDFRQSVSVTSGTTYDVSVWVYHTEGHMKARLYVDGYQGYSDNTIIDQWQQLTYTYVASATESIQVGLRFYDQSGFDGSEIVFEDDFDMVAQSSSTAAIIFEEPFDSDLGAMSEYSVTGPNETWLWDNHGNPPGCSKMSGYNGAPVINEDWLITPAIDMSTFTNQTLHFDHARNYDDNSGLFVLISTDYDGTSDPSTQGTWTDLTSQFTFPASGSWSFIDAGTVDISAYTSTTTYVAFKYTSTDTTAATWEVDNVTVAGDPPPVYIVGSFQSPPWTPGDSAYLMSMNANGIYVLTKTLPAADNEYKVVEGPSWSDPNYPSTNQHIIMAVSGDTTWRVNADANLVTHTLPVVAGNFFSAMGGNDWDPTELMGQMTDTDGDDVYTLTLLVPSGSWECKVTLNQNWDQSTGSNTPFTANGVDSTTFTYDFTTNTTTVSAPPPPSATVTFVVIDTTGQNYDGFNLKGSWGPNGNYDSGWNGGAEHSAFYDDGTHGDTLAGDHIWTCQQQLIPDNGANTWEWGINDTEHNWIAGNWQFTVPDTNAQTQSFEIPATPALIINEIMYNSPGADEEWIELYNNTSDTMNLENWKVLDDNASHTPIVIPAGYILAPGGYFTIEIATAGNFPFSPDYDGSGNFSLGNSGDAVRLYNADGYLIDIVVYSDSSPWPTQPDGGGPTLALIDPNSDNSLAASWAASTQDGGTPGALNFPPVPYITVLTPNGGENIDQGSDYDVTWDYGYWDGNIEIDLQKGSGTPQQLVYNLPITGGLWTWHVPDNQELGNDYKIIISGINTGDPTDESDTTFSIIEPYTIPDLVFTEIMYNPPESGIDSLEFLEIYNNGTDTVDMLGYSMTQGVGYTFPSIILYPSSYLVIAKDSMSMLNTFSVNAWQWTSGSLSNSGEDIELSDSLGNQVDYVNYSDQLPWDTLADGYGPSLTLCNPSSDNSLPENWTHSVHFEAVNADGDSIWATPGTACQVPLLANFSADTTLILVGDSVLFIDQTIGNPTSWSWTFEGGNPATFEGQNPPFIIYTTAGQWDVTLVVSDGMNTDSITRFDYIWSGVAPEVTDFVADETTVTVGSFTNFTSTTIGDSLSFLWTFEGGTPEYSSDENPQNIYYLINADSLYDVTLTVSNLFGSDTLFKDNYIHTKPEGVSENEFSNITLYPNPANNVLFITNPKSATLKIIIVDMVGKTVLSKQIESANTKLNVAAINKGVYLVRIVDVNTHKTDTRKLIIR